MLSVYVDDFKMAGATQNIKKAWEAVRKSGIQIDEPIPFAHYLGCNQHATKVSKKQAETRLQNISDLLPDKASRPSTEKVQHDIKSIVYDMQDSYTSVWTDIANLPRWTRPV